MYRVTGEKPARVIVLLVVGKNKRSSGKERLAYRISFQAHACGIPPIASPLREATYSSPAPGTIAVQACHHASRMHNGFLALNEPYLDTYELLLMNSTLFNTFLSYRSEFYKRPTLRTHMDTS